MRGTRSLPLLLFLGALARAVVPSAAAQPPAEVVAVDFAGNRHFGGKQLRGVMETRRASFLQGAPFDRDLLAADLRAIRELYRRHGFLEAEVTGEPKTINTRTVPHQVAVEITIIEGPQYRVGGVRFAGHAVFPAEELQKALRMGPGDPFDPVEVERERYRLIGLYLDEGHLEIQVTAEAGEEGLVRDLSYYIEEGSRFRVRDVLVEGNLAVREEIIRRELTLSRGSVFRRREALVSEQNVYDTGLFTVVDLVPLPAETIDGVVDLSVRVRERKMRWLGAGLGYGTMDELRLSGEWGDRNLGGSGRRVDLEALFATELFPRDTRRVLVEAGLVSPWFLGTRAVGAVKPFFERRRVDFRRAGILVGTYRVQGTGASASLRRDFGERTRIWFSYTHEWLRLRSAAFAPTPTDFDTLGFDRDGRAQEASVTLSVEHDKRDALLNPTRGSHIRILGEITAGRPWGFDRPYARWAVDRSWYHPTGSQQTLSWRFSIGGVGSFDPEVPVPDRERFKIGGETSVRGYQDREIGPGNVMFTTSAEYFYPLRGKIRGVIFVEGGGVWGEWRDVKAGHFSSLDHPESFRYSVGLGVRIPTPVGPVRLGYAQQIRRLVSGKTGRPYVIFGQGF